MKSTKIQFQKEAGAYGRGYIKSSAIVVDETEKNVTIRPTLGSGALTTKCWIGIPNEDRAKVGFAIMGKNPLSKMNWSLLREQKYRLLGLLDAATDTENKEDAKALQGILNMIDAIQDYCADTLGLPVEFLME